MRGQDRERQTADGERAGDPAERPFLPGAPRGVDEHRGDREHGVERAMERGEPEEPARADGGERRPRSQRPQQRGRGRGTQHE